MKIVTQGGTTKGKNNMSLITCEEHGSAIVVYDDYRYGSSVKCPACEEIADLKRDNNEIADSNKELEEQISQFEIQIESHEANALSLETEIQTNYESLRELESEILDLKAQIRYNEQRISELEADIELDSNIRFNQELGEW